MTDFSYDSQTQRLVKKLTEINGIFIQDYNYQYDSLGNIIELADNSISKTAKTMNYEYDTLSRLVRATATNTASNSDFEETYSYDWLGNILNKSDVGDYVYDNNNPHQASAIGLNNYTYDANGNVINDGNNVYVYSANNRLVKASSSDNGIISNYTYDPSGTRVYKKVVNTADKISIASNNSYDSSHGMVSGESGKYTESSLVETYYPNSFYEYVNSNNNESVSLHVYGLGQRLAQIDGTSVKLIFTDHLGSTQHVVSDRGEVLASYDYYPFGGVRIGGEDRNSKKGFIGKELDETNLNYVEARYLNTSIGKFGQIDPVSLTQEKIDVQQVDPQSFNSYSYSRNNPVVLADKDGEFWAPIVAMALMSLPSVVNGLQNLLTLPGIKTLAESGQTLNNKKSSGLAKTGAVTSIFLSVLPVKSTAPLMRTKSVAEYFHKVAQGNIDEIVNMNGLYKANQGFKFTGRTWSIGQAQDSIASLVGHFFKHYKEVGARTIDEYYGMANNIIKSVDNKRIIQLPGSQPGTLDFVDIVTKNIVGVNQSGQISTFHKVTDLVKWENIINKINK